MIRVALCDERESEWGFLKALMREHLTHFELHWERSIDSALRSMERGDHDVFLLDSGGIGGRLFARAIESGVGACLVLLMPRADRDEELKALRDGAAEVLVRTQMSPDALAAVLLRARARSSSFVTPVAVLDEPWVGVGTFRARLDATLSRAKRTREPVALLMLQVRDASHEEGFGPSAGAVYVAAAERIRSCLREYDSVCKLDDGRFLVLLGELEHPGHAAIHADRLISALIMPLTMRGFSPQIKASVAIAVAPDDGQTAPALLQGVESAIELLKKEPGSHFRFISAPMNEKVERSRVLLRALDGALEREEFSLAYQPQVSSATHEVLGVEALLRWKSPKLGFVSPAEFIPVLESAGLIEKIGAWVLDRACQQASEWYRRGVETRVSINVSARQVAAGGFDTLLASTLERRALPPSLLGIELTEGVLLEDAPAVRALLNDIRRQGVSIAVDDFGTGYASLSYIKRFPMDVIKIDKEFVRGLPLDVENVAITSAIVALAQSLGLKVVAEGVEDIAELEFLRSLGCNAIQGYYFAKPMTPPDYEVWRQRHEATVS